MEADLNEIASLRSSDNLYNTHLWLYILCASVAVRNKDVAPGRFLRTRATFSQSVMVSVGVSALEQTGLHFVDQGAIGTHHL